MDLNYLDIFLHKVHIGAFQPNVRSYPFTKKLVELDLRTGPALSGIKSRSSGPNATALLPDTSLFGPPIDVNCTAERCSNLR